MERRRVLCAVVAVLGLLARDAASLPPEPEKPIISAGREEEVLRLLTPFRNGVELAPGWSVASVEIPQSHIRLVLAGPGGRRAALLLRHPSQSNSLEQTASFLLEREGEAEAQTALAQLAEAIRRNDAGGFWTGLSAQGDTSSPALDRPEEPFERKARSSAWGTLPEQSAHFRPVMPFLLDGLLIAALACVLVLMHLRRALVAAPRWVPWTLAAFVVFGALLRLAVAPETVMNAWPYSRNPPLVKLILTGGILRHASEWFGLRIYVTDATHRVDLMLAIAAPIAVFAHARFALNSWKSALFATGILVVLPIHIHFARSDIEYVQSLVTSSLTFTALYIALREESRRWRWVALGLLPLLSLATYSVRPENLVFVAIDTGAVLLTAGRDVPWPRRLVVLGVVLAAGLYSLFFHLLVDYQPNVQEGLSLATLASAARILFDTQHNTLINSWITPPLLIVLAGAGLVTLLRGGDWRRALYLSCWLAGFFVVHSFVVPHEPAMMARYHMHLVTPTLLLAGAATPMLLGASRWAKAAIVVTLALSPVIHRSFIGADDFMIMREYDLIRRHREVIPAGCTVLEFLPADSLETPENLGDSRMIRHGAMLSDGELQRRWKVVSLAVLPASKDGAPVDHEVLSPEAEALLATPPACLVFLEGLTCHTHRPEGTARAPVCDEVLRRMQSQPLVESTFPARVYDERNTGRLGEVTWAEDRIGMVVPGEPIHVALHSLRPLPDPPAPAAATGESP